jgi:hypothetical protein
MNVYKTKICLDESIFPTNTSGRDGTEGLLNNDDGGDRLCPPVGLCIYSLRPVKSVHLEILGQIMELSKKCIGKVQAIISLLFNYLTPNELSACRN